MSPDDAAWIRDHVLLDHLRTPGQLDLDPACLCQRPGLCVGCWNDQHHRCGHNPADARFEAQISAYGGFYWPIRALVWLADRVCRRPCTCLLCAETAVRERASPPVLPAVEPRQLPGGAQQFDLFSAV